MGQVSRSRMLASAVLPSFWRQKLDASQGETWRNRTGDYETIRYTANGMTLLRRGYEGQAGKECVAYGDIVSLDSHFHGNDEEGSSE